MDHFSFDWDVSGAHQITSKNVTVVGGLVETPSAGSAYVFRRMDNSSFVSKETVSKGLFGRPCNRYSTSCEWKSEKKLLPSDKRSNMQFGSSVAVNDASGVVVVGAPNADLIGFYRDSLTHYPYYVANGTSDAAGLRFPLPAHEIRKFQSSPSFGPLSSAGYGVWQVMHDQQVFPNFNYAGNCGAIYTFQRLREESGDDGELWRKQGRFETEQSKLQPPDCTVGDHFGSTLYLDQQSLLVGSPEHSNPIIHGGAAYFFRTDYVAVNFSQVLPYYILSVYSLCIVSSHN